MHEWALAEGVVATVLDMAKKQNIKIITGINIKIGQLQGIEKEVVRFALKEIVKPNPMMSKKLKVRIREEKAVFKCKVCGRQWRLPDVKAALNPLTSEAIHFVPEVAYAYINCPGCKSPDFEMLEGRELWIESVTGERGG